MRGVFVTGTDTGVGKTLACCALVHALREAGEAVFPMKPIAAGAVERDGRSVNEDTMALLEAAGLGVEALDRVTPILLREPMSPHIAAAREGRRIWLEPVIESLRAASGFRVVEGVGGFMVPLGETLDTVDLARAIGLPVVLVVGLRLGCLNHSLLTARAIGAAGLDLAGWIANAIDPRMLVVEENVETLRARIAAPLLGRLPWHPRPDPRALARSLDVRPLLGASA
ncbi:MAG TPA: dethiobiotin synthase [Usitatibacter sp.]|nr:dethiobiotin synthase [Usitatibacter sp.]